MIIKVILLYLSITDCVSTRLDDNLKHAILDTLGEWCPYTNFCKTSAARNISVENKVSCCVPCSCEDGCEILGNCCPDKDDQLDINQNSILPCKDTLVRWTFQGQKPFHTSTFRVIDFCSDSETDADLVRKCSVPDTDIIDELVWVSDKNGRIYQNKYCAVCHMIEDYTYWTVETDCEKLSTDVLSAQDVFQNHSCSLLMRAPFEMTTVIDRYQCFVPDITRCNESGSWQNLNETVAAACDSFFMPFVTESASGQLKLVYKNVYCLLCNPDKRNKFPILCSTENIKGGSRPFGTLLDYTRYVDSRRQNVAPTYRCDYNQIYDPYLDVCHKLHCPIGETALWETCEKEVIRRIGSAIQVAYKIKNSVNGPTALANSENLTKTLHNIFLSDGFEILRQRLDFESVGCTIFRQQLFSFQPRESLTLDDYFMLNIAATADRCDLSVLNTKMVSVLGEKVTIDANLVWDIQFDYVYSGNFSELYEKAFWWGPSVTKPMYIYPVHTLLSDKMCPKIYLNHTEILYLASGAVEPAIVSLFPSTKQMSTTTNHTVEENTVEICIQDYFSSLSHSNAAVCLKSKTNLDHVTVTGMATVVYLIITI